MANTVSSNSTTIPISEGSRNVVSKLKNHNLLAIGVGENETTTKDIYLLAVALGQDNPTEKLLKPESWTRTEYFDELDKAIIKAAYIGTMVENDDIINYISDKEAFAYSRKLTDSGFVEIDKLAQKASYDSELMVKYMLEYADKLYDELKNTGIIVEEE